MDVLKFFVVFNVIQEFKFFFYLYYEDLYNFDIYLEVVIKGEVYLD